MKILNKHTGETMTMETYKKRRDLEEYYGMYSQALYEWPVEKIEMEWYKEFQAD